MPMGMRNSSATHQQWVTLALKDYIGKICHVYLDVIIIWSNSLAEHRTNVALILKALWKAELYCSQKKSTLFTMGVDFLGHHISAWGIKADDSKVKWILNWLPPKSAKHIQQFLGLVRYILVFLPTLAEHMAVLTPLTYKKCNTSFPQWTSIHQYMFESIKRLVVSQDCLMTINHESPRDNKIFMTCNTSKQHMGTILAFGPSWKSAQPIVFESRQLNSAEWNYPVHEQEMLTIMQAQKKWRVDLLGTHIHIHTDHKTLQNFDFQRDLSQQQAQWMKYLSQYGYTITYVYQWWMKYGCQWTVPTPWLHWWEILHLDYHLHVHHTEWPKTHHVYQKWVSRGPLVHWYLQ